MGSREYLSDPSPLRRREKRPRRLIAAIIVLDFFSSLDIAVNTIYDFLVTTGYKNGNEGFPSRSEVAVDLISLVASRCNVRGGRRLPVVRVTDG